MNTTPTSKISIIIIDQFQALFKSFDELYFNL